MPRDNGFQNLLDRLLGREERAERLPLTKKFQEKSYLSEKRYHKLNKPKKIFPFFNQEMNNLKIIANDKSIYPDFLKIQNNLINDEFLDRHYENWFLRQNNIIDNNIFPLDQFNPFNDVDGHLSAHNGKIFNAAELEGIEVELVLMSAEEEAALFDAHKRFIERSASKVAEEYQRQSGSKMDDVTFVKVQKLISLKIKERKFFGTEDVLTSVRNQTIEQEISSLGKKQHFSAEQLAKIKTSAQQRKETPTHAALFAQGNRRYFKITATGCGKVQKNIEEALQSKGYTVLDYQNGIATESAEGRRGKQQFKIGKLLKDNQALLDAYAKDPLRTLNGLMVVLSQDPMDIAMMSTNRGWRSCMSHDGLNFRYVYEDIRAGTIVSYLTSVSDPMIHDPLSRVSLKPFKRAPKSLLSAWRGQEDDVIFRLGPNYGIPNAVFYKALQQYASTQMNAGKEGTFEMANGLYQDGMRRQVKRGKVVKSFAPHSKSMALHVAL